MKLYELFDKIERGTRIAVEVADGAETYDAFPGFRVINNVKLEDVKSILDHEISSIIWVKKGLHITVYNKAALERSTLGFEVADHYFRMKDQREKWKREHAAADAAGLILVPVGEESRKRRTKR